MARIVVGVDASPGALRALAAPLYLPSREALPGRSGAEDRKPAAPPRVAGPEAHP